MEDTTRYEMDVDLNGHIDTQRRGRMTGYMAVDNGVREFTESQRALVDRSVEEYLQHTEGIFHNLFVIDCCAFGQEGYVTHMAFQADNEERLNEIEADLTRIVNEALGRSDLQLITQRRERTRP